MSPILGPRGLRTIGETPGSHRGRRPGDQGRARVVTHGSGRVRCVTIDATMTHRRPPPRPVRRARRSGRTDDRLARRGRGRPGPCTSASTCSTSAAAFLLATAIGGFGASLVRRPVADRCRPTPTSSRARPGSRPRPGRASGARPRPAARGRRPAGRARRGRDRHRGARPDAARRLGGVLAGAARRHRAGGAVAAGRRGAARALGGQHRPHRLRPGGRRQRGRGVLGPAGGRRGSARLGPGAVRAADRAVRPGRGRPRRRRRRRARRRRPRPDGRAVAGPAHRRPVRGARRPGARRRSAPTWPRTSTTPCSRRSR